MGLPEVNESFVNLADFPGLLGHLENSTVCVWSWTSVPAWDEAYAVQAVEVQTTWINLCGLLGICII